MHRFIPTSLTVAVMLLVAMSLLVINSAGWPVCFSPGRGWNSFGWPETYLETPLTDEQFDEIAELLRTGTLNASPKFLPLGREAIEQLDRQALLTNVMVGCLYVAAYGFTTEFLQRSLRSPRALQLRDLFFGTLMIAVAIMMTHTPFGATLWYRYPLVYLVNGWITLVSVLLSIAIVFVASLLRVRYSPEM